MNKPVSAAIRGEEHWTTKGADVRLFLWEKYAGDPGKTVGTILFVHGSSMASQPTFDLQVPGRSDSSKTGAPIGARAGWQEYLYEEDRGHSTVSRSPTRRFLFRPNGR